MSTAKIQWKLIKIIFLLFLSNIPLNVFGCWDVHVNGPLLVCPSVTYEFQADKPPEVLCNAFTTADWFILNPGYAHFVDQNGADLGDHIHCEDFGGGLWPCIPGGVIRMRTYSFMGFFRYRVEGNCSGVGTAT